MKNDESKEQEQIMKEMIEKWKERKEQDDKEWNRRGPFPMRNGLGGLNIYLKLIGFTFMLILFMGYTIFIIWRELIPEGRITWGHSLMLVIGIGVASLCAWTVLCTVQDIREGQASLVGFIDEKKIDIIAVTGASRKQHRIRVKGVVFNVSEGIYKWVSQGDEILVTYWPHSKTVSKVNKTGKWFRTNI